MPQLVQPLRRIEILQPLLTQVAEVGFDQAGGRAGENDLATVRRRADARRPVHIDTDVALAGHNRLAGVDADTDAHLAGGQRGLPLPRRRCRVGGCGEGVKEGIPLHVDLDTTVALEGVTKDPAVLAQNLAVTIAELLQQARRTLDVGEHQGDRPGWQSAARHSWNFARDGAGPSTRPRTASFPEATRRLAHTPARRPQGA